MILKPYAGMLLIKNRCNSAFSVFSLQPSSSLAKIQSKLLTTVATRFLKLSNFWKTFAGRLLHFSCHLPNKCNGLTCFARALRHLQVHVYRWISI